MAKREAPNPKPLPSPERLAFAEALAQAGFAQADQIPNKFYMIILSPTPACRNLLRRAGTNHENSTDLPSPLTGEGLGGGDHVTYYPPP